MLRELKYTWKQIASALMIGRTTLWRRLREMGINSTYTELTGVELHEMMHSLVRRIPNNGVVMMWGHLCSLNIFVSRHKVHDSLTRVSGSLIEARQSTTVQHRVYSVLASNCLWHIDGLHCLIRWRIVIHRGIDGYSRRIVYLEASDNNRADSFVSV